MSARRSVSMVPVCLCLLVCGLAISSAPALAAKAHVFSGSFGAASSTVVDPEPLSAPAGVAVGDATGNVYVVDRGNNRVEYFASSGAYLGQFNGAAAPTGAFSTPEAVAVDNSTSPLDPSAGDVYVTDTGHNVIDKFSATGVYLGQLTETSSGNPLRELYGVAVDPSGTVWLYRGSGEIDSFNDALANEFSSARNSPFGTGPGFAVDSKDDLYVRRGSGVFAKLDSAGQTLIEEVDGEEASAAGVEPSSDAVYIDNLKSIGEFAAAGSSIERFGGGRLASGMGVAVDAAGTAYVADASANLVDVFTLAQLPSVSTGPAFNVGETTATVSGTINPEGAPSPRANLNMAQVPPTARARPANSPPRQSGRGRAQ